MAHRKAGGTTRLGRDSISKRLGVKLFGGQTVAPGAVIIKQRGTKYHAGKNVKKGSDDTLYALKYGVVKFFKKKVKKFDGRLIRNTFVAVEEKKEK